MKYYTTKNQAERLVEAGMPIDTGDVVLGLVVKDDKQLICPLPAGTEFGRGAMWSISALWDFLHNIDKTYEVDTEMSSSELMEWLVDTICFRLKNQ